MAGARVRVSRARGLLLREARRAARQHGALLGDLVRGRGLRVSRVAVAVAVA